MWFVLPAEALLRRYKQRGSVVETEEHHFVQQQSIVVCQLSRVVCLCLETKDDPSYKINTLTLWQGVKIPHHLIYNIHELAQCIQWCRQDLTPRRALAEPRSLYMMQRSDLKTLGWNLVFIHFLWALCAFASAGGFQVKVIFWSVSCLAC